MFGRREESRNATPLKPMSKSKEKLTFQEKYLSVGTGTAALKEANECPGLVCIKAMCKTVTRRPNLTSDSGRLKAVVLPRNVLQTKTSLLAHF